MEFNTYKEILIVDDEQDEIDELAEVFSQDLDCSVLTYLYEQDELIHKKHTNIRVAFFDLNISATSIHSDSHEDINWRNNDSLRKVFNDLTQAIIDVIDSNNGPYALIFWTKHIEYVEEFKKYIYGRSITLPNPIHISCLDKVEFRSSCDKKTMIKDVMQDTVFYNLMNFENILQNEVQKMMFNILDIANEDSMSVWNGNSYHNNLQSFLRTVASTHSGFNRARENPSRSLTEALVPILTDKLIKKADETQLWDSFLDFEHVNKKDCKFSKDNNIPKLNSFFHIDSNPKSYETRGAVFKLVHPQKFFREKFNYKHPKTVIAETLNEFPKDSRDQVQFILIEISSACDYSQDKTRFNKYIVGLKIPKECYEIYSSNLKANSKNLRHSVLDLKSSFYDDVTEKSFNIFLNKNFVLTLNFAENNNETIEHLFTFKKEMMDFIGNAYSNHVSRIGTSIF